MYRLTRIQTPAKIFIIAISSLVIVFIAGVSYLSFTQNSVFDQLYYFISDYTETEETIEEDISYITQQVEDENLDEGATKTQQEGVVGRRRITYRVLRDKSGREIKRTIISDEIITTPTDEIIAKGAKKPEEPEPEESSSSISYSYDSGGYAYYGGGSSSYSGNSDGGYSGGGGQQAQPQQESTPAQTSSIHYCTTPHPAPNGKYYERLYLKQDKPCGQTGTQWDNHYIEVSESEYYSHDFKWDYGGMYGIYEIRTENCGTWNPEHSYGSCKIY